MDLDELLERAQGRQPPNLEPVGQCPYCHHELEKREVSQERDWKVVPIGGPPPYANVLLTFWACMNDECCLMFWRHPRLARWTPPVPDDNSEH